MDLTSLDLQEVNKSDLLLRLTCAVKQRQVVDRYLLPRSTWSRPFYVLTLGFLKIWCSSVVRLFYVENTALLGLSGALTCAKR